MTVFKIIASKGGQVVFDDRVEASTPREARRKMKERLGLESLSGVVYAITEIPIPLIRQIVAEQMAKAVVQKRGGRDIDIEVLVRRAVETTSTVGAREPLAATTVAPPTSALRRDPLSGNPAPPAARGRASTRASTEATRGFDGPDWKKIKRAYLRSRRMKQTAAEFNVPVNTLKARARREGWGK
jgi:hypothetical protein